MSKIVILALLTVVLLPTGVRASVPDPPISWGVVPADQLAMTSYPPDSSANAVILCDYGDVRFDSDYNIIYRRHCRIKILRRAGFSWGTHAISYYAKDKTQKVKNIEGLTISVNADGTIQKKELDDESIFTEKLNDNWKVVRFTLPALTEGCIVEYRYTIESPPLYFPDWEFQTSEPTLWSELRTSVPPVFGYAVYTQGYDRYFIKEVEVLKEVSRGAGGLGFSRNTVSRWVMKDIGALREEPYITTVDDYVDKMKFQLSMVAWPGYPPQQILESWEVVAKELFDAKTFGDQLSGFGSVTKATKTVTQGIEDSLQKAIAIYDYLRRSIVWNGKKRVFTDKDLDDVLEAKTGSSAEINLLLVLMLREAGLVANPAVLSTRQNGKIYTGYPIVDQFDYVIARLIVGGKQILLDATDPMRPFSLLSVRALNETALSLTKEGYEWIPVVASGKGVISISITGALNEEGAIRARCEKSFDGYSAVGERKSLADDKEDHWLKSTLGTESAGLTVDSFMIANNEDHEKPLIASAFISSNQSQPGGDIIYLNPVIINRMTDNPFTLLTREFPVDYAYPRSTRYSLKLTLPDGYDVAERPKDISISLGQGMGTFSRHLSADSSVLTLDQSLEVTTTIIPPRMYRQLRPFYDRIVALQNEQMVLQKKPPPKIQESGGKKKR